MNNEVGCYPELYKEILEETEALGFDQLSDGTVGSFLATISASKRNGKFLELGTGTGLCTSWLLKGMCELSELISVDNDGGLVEVAKKYLGSDKRVEFIVGDGEDVIENTAPLSIDLIFADTWPGKYNHLEETLRLLKVGGIYLVDDMLPQKNWPKGHEVKAKELVECLKAQRNFSITEMHWSTGLIMCVKNA